MATPTSEDLKALTDDDLIDANVWSPADYQAGWKKES